MRIVPTGDVRQVKVLGVLAMIDDGETDWKILAIDAEDRWAPELNDVEDVERLLPGVVYSMREWFRTYKIPDGKPPNAFGLGEKCMPKPYAMKVINECHMSWRKLVSKVTAGDVVPRNLSVSKLNDLASEMEPENVFDQEDALDAEDLEDYPSSLIA